MEMDKAYDGFLNSQLLWEGDALGVMQFDLSVSPTQFDSMVLPSVDQKRRLGHQAEFVFLQLMLANGAYQIVAHSLQLIESKRTLGEIDFIVREIATGQVLHIELTYKFYLLDNAIKEPMARLVGPNRKDSFVYKLSKTIDKQLPLLYSNPCMNALEELNLEVESIEQRVAFYGHVFVPYGTSEINIEGINEACNAGFWVAYDAFVGDPFEKCRYYLPHQYERLHIPHLEVEWKSYAEILELVQPFIDQERSPMLWMQKVDGLIERVFVTAR